jgi:hypothetical protein
MNQVMNYNRLLFSGLQSNVRVQSGYSTVTVFGEMRVREAVPGSSDYIRLVLRHFRHPLFPFRRSHFFPLYCTPHSTCPNAHSRWFLCLNKVAFALVEGTKKRR